MGCMSRSTPKILDIEFSTNNHKGINNSFTGLMLSTATKAQHSQNMENLTFRMGKLEKDFEKYHVIRKNL